MCHASVFLAGIQTSTVILKRVLCAEAPNNEEILRAKNALRMTAHSLDAKARWHDKGGDFSLSGIRIFSRCGVVAHFI